MGTCSAMLRMEGALALGVINAVFAKITTDMPLANQIALFYKQAFLIGSVNYLAYLRQQRKSSTVNFPIWRLST